MYPTLGSVVREFREEKMRKMSNNIENGFRKGHEGIKEPKNRQDIISWNKK